MESSSIEIRHILEGTEHENLHKNKRELTVCAGMLWNIPYSDKLAT